MLQIVGCRLLKYCVAALFLGTLAIAGTDENKPAIQVEYSSRSAFMTVKIAETSTLAAVLREVCVKSEARCEGIQQLTQPVSASQFGGSWAEVVSKLMEGTR